MPGPAVPPRTGPDTPQSPTIPQIPLSPDPTTPQIPLSPRSRYPTAHTAPNRRIGTKRPRERIPRCQSNIMIDLSYVSTDLFWTKISTANTKVAFLPPGQGSCVWEKPFAIQSHKSFSHAKNLRERHQRNFRAKFKVRKSTNWHKKPPTGNTPNWFVKSSKSGSRQPAEIPPTGKILTAPQVRKPPTVRTAYHAKSTSHRLAQKPPTVPMGFLTGQTFNHASRAASDSHSELESVPAKSKTHQLAEILRPQRIPPGVTPPPSSRRCRAPNGGVEHTNRAKVGLTLSDS